jgi:predicted TIM-barrel fold metal-dependent hydrolase
MGATTPEPLGLVTCVGTQPEQLRWTGAKYGETIHPSCYDGAERLKIMDEDGVDAEMLYPPQRAMLTFMKNKDTDAHLAGIRAYNRWLKDGFCAPDPARLDRHLPDAERRHRDLRQGAAARQEGRLPRRRDLGLALRRRSAPARGRSLLGGAAEVDMPVSIHLLLAASQTKTVASKAAAVAIGASAFALTMPLITEMIFQGVFDRFPKLRMAAVEPEWAGIPTSSR